MTNNVNMKNLTDIAKNLIAAAETKAKETDPNSKTQVANKIDTEAEKSIFAESLEALKQSGELSDAEVNEIWNIALTGVKTDEPEKTDNTENKPVVSGLDKNQKNNKKTEVLNDILDVIVKQGIGFNWDDMVPQIEKKLGNLKTQPYYKQLLSEVQTVVDFLKTQTYESRQDIKEMYVNVSKSLKDLDDKEFKSFRKDVLNNLIRAAEKEQMAKEKNKVLGEYDRLRAEGKSREEAMNSIRANENFKGSYYTNYTAYDVTESNQTVHAGEAPEHKGVISLVEEGEVMTEARKDVWGAIYELKDHPNVSSEKDVRVMLDEALTPVFGKMDKYTKKVLNGERTFREKVNSEPSVTKAYMRKTAIDNSVKTLRNTPVNEKYFTDELKNTALFESLVKSGLVTERKDADGKPMVDAKGNPVYDLTGLSELVEKQLGANSKADRQLSEMRAISEVQNTLEKTLAAIDNKFTKLTPKDTKRLIKLCGYPVEGKNWWKIAADTLDKTFTMGLVGLGAALVTPPETVRGTVSGTVSGTVEGTVSGTVSGVTTGNIPVSIEINDTSKTTLNLSLNGASMKINDYMNIVRQVQQQGGTITSWQEFQKTGVMQVVIDNSTNPNSHKIIETVLTDKSLPFEKAFEEGYEQNYEKGYEKDFDEKAGDKTKRRALINALMFGLAVNFLTSALGYQKAEKPVIATQFAETDLEKYQKTIDANQTLSDTQKEGLKTLAAAFKDVDGNWDSEAYKQLLNRIAGDSGLVNKTELEIGVFEAQKDFEMKALEKKEKSEDVNKPSPEPEPAKVETPPKPVEIPQTVDDSKFIAKGDINMPDSNKYYWEEIIQKYYGEALAAGVPEKKIRFKLREVNNKIMNNYKAIPPNLVIPEDLFGDGTCKRTAPKPDSEIKMRPRTNTDHPLVKAHKTPDGAWVGGREYTDKNGVKQVEYYPQKYKTEQEALKGAEEEYNRRKVDAQ